MRNKSIYTLDEERLSSIKMIVFDVDGVLVPRGTFIKRDGDILELGVKVVPDININGIRDLYNLGYYLNISSGRSLSMLQEMFRPVLDYVSLTFENGSASWAGGTVVQHVNSYMHLRDLYSKLLVIKDDRIRGWEPKEFIITIHCTDRVPVIEDTVIDFNTELYCLWNGEAYDIGIRDMQTKGVGVASVANMLRVKKNNILAIGDNYNDVELLSAAGMPVSADKDRVEGEFHIPLSGSDVLPATTLMHQILKLKGLGGLL